MNIGFNKMYRSKVLHFAFLDTSSSNKQAAARRDIKTKENATRLLPAARGIINKNNTDIWI